MEPTNQKPSKPASEGASKCCGAPIVFDDEQMPDGVWLCSQCGLTCCLLEPTPASESAREALGRLKNGPRTLDAKWLDPKCWDGCQSLVFKEALSAQSWEVAELREANQQMKSEIEKTMAVVSRNTTELTKERDQLRADLAAAQRRIEELQRCK